MSTFTLQDLNLPTTADEAIKQAETIGGIQHAELPQPTLGEVLPNPDLPSIINNICAQLQLLATVIGGQARGNSHAEDQSLQQCVALTLQQADWFKEMVGACVDAEMVRESVQDVVESEVELYFDNRFDPSEHFDFGDAVADRVDEMLDDVVRERVMDSLEEVVAEKLSEASVSISF